MIALGRHTGRLVHACLLLIPLNSRHDPPTWDKILFMMSFKVFFRTPWRHVIYEWDSVNRRLLVLLTVESNSWEAKCKSQNLNPRKAADLGYVCQGQCINHHHGISGFQKQFPPQLTPEDISDELGNRWTSISFRDGNVKNWDRNHNNPFRSE